MYYLIYEEGTYEDIQMVMKEFVVLQDLTDHVKEKDLQYEKHFIIMGERIKTAIKIKEEYVIYGPDEFCSFNID